MLRALLFNLIFVATAALLGMGLFSGKLRGRCYSIADGTPEPHLRTHRTCDRSPPGFLAGRACPTGSQCLALGAFDVWSFDSAPWAALSIARLVSLSRWGELYALVADAAGAPGAAFVLGVVGVGGLVTRNVFAPLLALQLEKLCSRSYLETGRRTVRRALNRRLATAFLAWRADWQAAQQAMGDAVRRRANANPDVAEKFARRFRAGGARLRAWNIWVARVRARKQTAPGVLQLRAALLERDPPAEPPTGPNGARRRSAASLRPRQADQDLARPAQAAQLEGAQPPASRRWTASRAGGAVARAALSRRLQLAMSAAVVASACLMGFRTTCDAPPGRALGCAEGSTDGLRDFEARVEAALLILSILLIAETALRLAVLGVLPFLADGFNRLDLLVSAVSLADVVLSAPCRFAFLSGGAWCAAQANLRSPTALRSLRLVNVLRLLRTARSLRFPVFELIELVRSAWILVPVMLFLAYVVALIGASETALCF
jgi:hypothetical protein